MRFRLPAIYDKIMDGLANVLFPPPVKIIGDFTAVELTLTIYFIIAAAGAIWWTGNWMWGLAVPLCAALAWMVDRWML
jgi:hypothetical protein